MLHCCVGWSDGHCMHWACPPQLSRVSSHCNEIQTAGFSHFSQTGQVYLILERIFIKCFIVIVFVSRSDYCSIVGLTIWQQIVPRPLGSLTIVSAATPSACLQYLILNLWGELSSGLNNLLHSARDLWLVACCSRAAAPPSLINTWSFAKTRLMYNYSGDGVVIAGGGSCQGTQRTQVDGCSSLWSESCSLLCSLCHDSIWIMASSIHPLSIRTVLIYLFSRKEQKVLQIEYSFVIFVKWDL